MRVDGQAMRFDGVEAEEIADTLWAGPQAEARRLVSADTVAVDLEDGQKIARALYVAAIDDRSSRVTSVKASGQLLAIALAGMAHDSQNVHEARDGASVTVSD